MRRRYEAFLNVLPPQQCFQADDAAGSNLELWLVMQPEFISPQSAGEPRLERDAACGRPLTNEPVEHVALVILTRCLESRLRVLQQRVGIRSIVRMKGDTGAHGGMKLVPLDEQGLREQARSRILHQSPRLV